MLTTFARLIFRRRRLVLFGTAAVIVAFAVLSAGTFGVLKGGGFDDPKSDSSQARSLIDSHFGGQTNLVFLATPTGGNLDAPAVVTAATKAVERLRAAKSLDNVVSYWTEHVPSLASRDHRAGLITALWPATRTRPPRRRPR
jgi:RND superfamily putative drug exporter